MKYDKILLEHGGGGLLTSELIAGEFLRHFKNPLLDRLEDSAVFTIGGHTFCFTTDSYVVSPIFFPGGDIGSLAVHGTVNDLAVCGGKPLFLSAGFIIEEGFEFSDLDRIVRSMSEAARRAGVRIVTGDTKVVPRGSGDGIFINTSGIGTVDYSGPLSTGSIRPGDAVLINGTMGDHGAAILSARESLGFSAQIVSDSAPLNGLVEEILAASPNVHCMRDATRGGVGAVLAEIAKSTRLQIGIVEHDIPVREEVRALCEVLGFDPLFLANEGKMVVFCSESDAERVLAAMRGHDLGRDAARIGTVGNGPGRVLLKTSIGGERVVDLPTGELVPRIC
ncbi:MAG: Hydrogenase expression/formation protein HypE [Syntrophaceae bacterium PtaU1.Bin231]|nr:MAG: Hydrogenase expression/formation protein HypE [Syntrophaceae bacterium PtaU1.Bin231]